MDGFYQLNQALPQQPTLEIIENNDICPE